MYLCMMIWAFVHRVLCKINGLKYSFAASLANCMYAHAQACLFPVHMHGCLYIDEYKHPASDYAWPSAEGLTASAVIDD